MILASQIRKVLHGYGIHSATIQPEFIEDQIDEKYQDELEDDDNEDIKAVHIHAESNTMKSNNNRVYGANDSSSTEVT